MANNASNVSVGKPMAAGGIYAGPTSATVPDDATTALHADIKGLGHCSDDGLTNSIEMETSDINAWGGARVLTVRTSRSESFSFTLIESLNILVLEQVYGPDNVSEVSGTLAVIHNDAELPNQLYVFEILMTGNKVKRIVVPDSKITEVGDVVYVDGDPVGYEVTLACFPDADGNTVYEYIAEIVDEPAGP